MTEGAFILLISAGIVLIISWIVLPFLVTGISNRLDKIYKLLKEESGKD